ncbi:MAG: hypothetical protein IPG80_04550 [Anaerolineales bacterium]|uniref:hypothetical protein n=1 Tax=Candidatus Villigracilis vicinus TaxID=3140679 RepID=UPI0031371558|nr:hypothetical protein [Anaerolineales bacterium]
MPGEWQSNPYGMKANVEHCADCSMPWVEKAILVGNSAGAGLLWRLRWNIPSASMGN